MKLSSVVIKFLSHSQGARRQGGSILAQLDAMSEFTDKLHSKSKELAKIEQQLSNLQVSTV